MTRAFIPIPSRTEVVNRLSREEGGALNAALTTIADKLSSTKSLPVRFGFEEFGCSPAVRGEVMERLKQAGWRVECVTTSGNELAGYCEIS